MKIISIATLKSFWEQYPDAEQPLKAWLDEAKKANWQSPMEIKELYRSASILKNSRVVFNIKGNDYRLVTSIFYAAGWVYIKFIGTHKQYDKIDANTVDIREVTK
ncbi:type II toxin-antitoxin system HigB family toxin [Serratia bockelmannii]|uniref:type II toxin-antitoxin system HigB family toxin n=1 Tax=Serratia bockelmannii TaxID=2703793 RepID=UPI0038C77EF6